MAHDPAFEAWLSEARDRAHEASVFDVHRDRYAALYPARRTSEGVAGACPICRDGDDRFSINTKKNVFNCRQCGNGGDAISLVQHADSVEFVQAVEIITGTSAPRSGEESSPFPPPNDEAERERREERRVAERRRADDERAVQAKKTGRIIEFFNGLSPFGGSPAEAYLRSRGIRLDPEMQADLRFCEKLEYRGFRDDDSEAAEVLGFYPAMVAAIRDVANNIIGVHRTYLDPETSSKLRPPGSRANKAKKVWGSQAGGTIRLGPVRPVMAMGEGIETTASWYQLGIGPDDIGVICGINLGNICGGCTAMVPHPSFPGQNNRSIHNGIPDPDKPGVALPEEVRHIILLGDGDSDFHATRAKMLTAGRRYEAEGREVSMCWPDVRGDFNDVLMGVTG